MDLAGHIIIGVWTLFAVALFATGIIWCDDGSLEDKHEGVIACLVSTIMLIPTIIHYFN